MKREYVKPVFVAESYSFNDTIARCEYQVDPNKKIDIAEGSNVCANDNGHTFGNKSTIAQNYFNGSIPKGTQVALFNDGIGSGNCVYDWAGPGKSVYGPDGRDNGEFAQAFYNNSADPKNHAPAFNGAGLFS